MRCAFRVGAFPRVGSRRDARGEKTQTREETNGKYIVRTYAQGRSTGDEEREKGRNGTPGWGEECRDEEEEEEEDRRGATERTEEEKGNDKRKNDEGEGKEEGTPMKKEEEVVEDEGRAGVTRGEGRRGRAYARESIEAYMRKQ